MFPFLSSVDTDNKQQTIIMITREDYSLRIHNIIKHCLHYQVSGHINQIDSD